MEKLKLYFKTPYEEKGLLKATLDFVFRAVTVVVWMYMVWVLSTLLVDALLHDYNPITKMWWFSYCFIVFVGGTWLAHIALFVRDYYEAED